MPLASLAAAILAAPFFPASQRILVGPVFDLVPALANLANQRLGRLLDRHQLGAGQLIDLQPRKCCIQPVVPPDKSIVQPFEPRKH